MKKATSLICAAALFLTIAAIAGGSTGSANQEPASRGCIYGGVIAPPTAHGHPAFVNGNSPDGSLTFNVLELIDGTAIQPQDISDIAIATWCEEHHERWEVLPFDSSEPNIRVLPADEQQRGFVVTDVRLRCFDGGILGGTPYSELTADGTWSRFVSMADCGECGYCGYPTTASAGGEDSESNPETGIILGSVPLLIAGSAVLIAKKRPSLLP
jgi:hypothetical protein